MDESRKNSETRTIRLEAGAQAVINGALVTASQPCEFEVGAGSYVLAGRDIDSSNMTVRNPREELYFSILEAGFDSDRFAKARFRLFDLLGQVVVRETSYQAQRECSACAAALMAGDADEAVRIAGRIASDDFGDEPRGGQYWGRNEPFRRKRPSVRGLRT